MIKLNKNRDLTTGSITGGLWSFAVLLMLGNVFQQFYNLADTWMVGKYVGDNALAAVARLPLQVYIYFHIKQYKAKIASMPYSGI